MPLKKMNMRLNIALSEITTLAGGLNFPEGPAFAPDGSLWMVELRGGNLVRYREGAVQRFAVGGHPNGIAIDGEGAIWFCDAGQMAIRKFDPADETTVIVASRVDREVLTKPNDLAFDALGNLVFTCPGESRTDPSGYACVLLRDGSVKKIAGGMFFPNGLAFTPDGKSLVIAETYRHRLWKGDWDAEKGEWLRAGPWCAVGGPNGPGGPDGMAFAPDGNLYVAVYGTGSVRIVDTDGKVIGQIPLPGQNPTNCAFDPGRRLGLVVTEAGKGNLLHIPYIYS